MTKTEIEFIEKYNIDVIITPRQYERELSMIANVHVAGVISKDKIRIIKNRFTGVKFDVTKEHFPEYFL